MKRFLQNLFLTSGFVLTALAALAQAPTFGSAATTSTTNIRVTFTGANLTAIPGGFGGFTVTGAAITAASIVGGAGNSAQVDLTVGALVPNFTCFGCVAVALNTVTNGTANAAILATGNDVTDGIIPVITSVSIPNAPMKVGSVVTATIIVNSDADAYTMPGGSTIGGFALGSLAKTNNTTYTATFTVTNPGTDVAAGSNIPINVVLQDAGGNNSTAFTTAIAQGGDPIDANNPVITAVSIPNVAMNVLDVVTATITVTNDGGDTYTLPGGSTIGGFALGSLSRTNSTTYTATFTITNGGTDVAAGSNIPISVILNDGATNVSNTFNTAISQGGDPIDANNPVITAVTIPNAAMNVTDVVTATITVTNDGGLTYTLPGGSTIGGFALGSLNRTNSTTYTATFTITDGGTDVTAAANIPISVTLNDPAANSSGAFTTAIVQAGDPIDANNPVITAVSIPNVAMKVLDVVTATITVNTDPDTYTLPGGSTINGYALGSLAKTNNTTYTATFTITNGGTDRAAGANIPISVILNDGATNVSNTFNTAIAQASDPIDANNPSFTSVLPTPNSGFRKIGDAVQINLTATGLEATLIAGGTLTVNGVDVSGTFTNLTGGLYRVTYTVGPGDTDRASGTLPINLQFNDAAGNTGTIVAFTAANTLVIDGNAPVITAVTIPNAPMKVTSVVTATITVTNDGGVTYTLPGGSTIGGFPLGGLLRTSSTTYTATFTVTNGGTDVAAGANIPISVTLNDPAGNASSNFNTAIAQGGDPIDANNPVITAVSIPAVAMKVNDVVTATITVNSDVDIYTLPGGSTINGFALGSLAKSNNTTYTATFTITNGGTDRTAGVSIPVSILLQDGATNNSNTFVTAIAQGGDPIDANNPAPFTVGAVITTGGTIRAGFWNSTNTGIDVTTPIANDASLTNGNLQIQAKVSSDVTWTSVGASSLIAAINTTKTISITAAQIEAIPNFGETKVVQLRSIITDFAGNATNGTQSGTTLLVDQIAPTIAGSPRIYFDAVNEDGSTGNPHDKEVVIFEINEPVANLNNTAVNEFRNDNGLPAPGTSINVSNSGKGVTGVATSFLTTFVRGQGVYTAAGTYMGAVASVATDLSLQLFDNGVSNYTGAFKSGSGVGVSDGISNDDKKVSSNATGTMYFDTFNPTYSSPTTFTRAVRIDSKDATSNWVNGTGTSQLLYIAGGNLTDLAGNEFTMTPTNIVSGNSNAPVLSPNVMTLFPRSTNLDKISFALDAILGQSGIQDGTGTITTSTSSTTVTGVGTAFDTEIIAGQQLWDANTFHYIGTVATTPVSATSLTLTANAAYALTAAPFNQSDWGGTITATTGSTGVTGVGTLFTGQMSVGQEIWDITGTQFIGKIASITNDTNLVLAANAANNITASPYIGAINGFTSTPAVPFAAIYSGKGSVNSNRITLLAQSNGAFTTGTTISYTSAGNAVGANGTELADITNHVVVMETQPPVITSVTVPNVSMKVGDVVTATITTNDDDGDIATLTSGALNGFALSGLVNDINGTTKTATFTVVEGGTDVAAGSNITFSTNLVLTDSSVPTASAAFSTAIVQASDRIDANSPKVLSINRQTTANNGAPSFGTSSATSIFRVTFNEDISAPSLSAADFAVRMKGIGTGTITSSTVSAAVTGVGTSFTTELIVGSEIWDRTGTTLVGIVSSITDDTNLVLTANAGTNLAGAPYSSPDILSLTGATITGVVAFTGTSVFDVTVGSYTGLGVLGIDYVDNNDASAVLDLAGNSTITSLVNPDGDFAGQTYQIVLPQPSTHVTAFTAVTTALDNYSIKLDWTGTSTGATNYLIIARGLTDLDAAGTYPAVADKTPVADDTNFADGSGAINISAALNTFTFTTLLSGKSYDFTIIPYALSPNNTTDNIDFFVAGAPVVNGTFVKRASATTLTAGSTAAPIAISSLSTAFAAKNFTFTIRDDGATAPIDNARTKFTQLVISAGVGNTVTNWSDVIQEAELRTVTETTTILASGAAIVGNTITFTTSIADNAEGEVDDNEAKEYELRIRLKNPMTGTAPQNVDGQIFVFQANVGGFTTAATPAPSLSLSSLVGVGETEDSGAGTTVNVVATQLSFTAPGTVQPPATAFVLTNLTATPIARAIDANGNTDTGYGLLVNITNTGGLPMTSSSITAASGIIPFPAAFQYQDDLVFAAGNGTLTISDGSLNTTSTSVTVSYSNTSTITAGVLSEPTTISSLTNASPGTQVFDFVINEDFGAAGDGSHTRLSTIVITQGTGNDIANWTQAIAGAQLSDGTNITPTSGTVTINPTNITISVIDVTTLGLILDGTSKTYTLRVWLNSAMGGALPSTVDNLNLVFEVLQAGITPTSLSSTIAPGENENSGSTNVAVDVITTKLVFSTSPAATLLPNVPVSTQLPVPVVEALDANNNRDLNYNSTTIAVVNAGTIPMANAPTASSLNSGILTFPGSFQYNNIGNGTLTVSSTTLPASGPAPTNAVSTGVSVQSGSATTFTAGGSASATIASTVNTLGAAVGAFNFTVNDDPAGTPPLQDDGNPTLMTQMIFNQIAPNTITDWTEAILGAELSDGTNITPASGTVTINPTNITISGITTHLARTGTITTSTASSTVTGVGTLFTTQLAVGQVLYDAAGTTRIGTISALGSPTSLTLTGNASITLAGVNYSTANLGLVADNGTKTYTLRIFLRTILGGTLPITIDGLAFGFEARTINFTTNLSGTSILPGQTQTSGANDVVTVLASKLSFVQLNGADGFAFPANPFPGTAFINAPFSPRLGMEAQDVNGNRDLGFAGAITAFTVNNSLGTANNPAGSFAGGLFKFPSLVPASSFNYTSGDNQDGALTVTAGGVTSTSPPINVRSSQDAYVYFDATGYKPLIKSATQQLASPPTPADANTSTTLARLVLSDGGAANFESTSVHSAVSDTDNAFTRISQIQFSVTNFGDLRTLALYNNAGVKISSDVAAAATVNFTGLNIQAADNDTIKFTVRTTFNSTIAADHDLIQLRITSVTQSAGSLLYQGATPPNAAYKGGILNGDLTPITVNQIDVVATKLVFQQNPPSFAGKNEPVPFSGTPGTIVRALDFFNNLDTDFDDALNGTQGDLSSVAGLNTPQFDWASGILDLTMYRYSTHGNGQLTVTTTIGKPLVDPAVPGVFIATPTAAVSTPVQVIHVDGTPALGGITASNNLAGGAVNKVIFGVTFTASGQIPGEPTLSQFRIGFGNLGTATIDQIFTNPRIFENASASFGGANITSFGGTVVTDGPKKNYVVSVPNRSINTAKSYFLVVDVVSTANGSSTPSVNPNVSDNGYSDPATNGNIVTNNGSATSAGTAWPKIYNFSSIFPPTLVSSYPASGQLNVDRSQPTISLDFSVPVWQLDPAGISLYDGANDNFVAYLPLASAGAGSGQYAGGLVANLGNPLVYNLPGSGLLLDDHVYYVRIDPGVFNGSGAPNNKGIMDQAQNLFTGISYSGALYFKTANPKAPNLLSLPIAGADPSVSNASTTGALITASFDQTGKAYFLVLPGGTAAPAGNQILTGTHPSKVASGVFDIAQIQPNPQFGFIAPAAGPMTAGATYDVWMSAVGYSENTGVLTQVPAAAPAAYGNVNRLLKSGTITTLNTSPDITGVGTNFTAELVPGRSLFDDDGTTLIGTIASISSPTSLKLAVNANVTIIVPTGYMASGHEVGASGPTFTFSPAITPAGVTLNTPSLSLCTNTYQPMSLPIIISESSSGSDFSSGTTNTMNFVLPAGFSFDASLTNGKPTNGILTVTGSDFTLPPTLPGVITTSTLSATVTGVGTNFLSRNAGDLIYNAAGTVLLGTVSSVATNTSMTLTANATATVVAAGYRGPYGPGNPQLGFVGSSILTVSYLNNGSSSIDKIIISDLSIISPSSSSGQISRFGGNALLPSIPELSAIATISSADASGITFTNSYSLIQFGNGSVTTIPDKFKDDINGLPPNTTQLFPAPPYGDFGPSNFSGPGVNINILNLRSVTLNTPFNITISHKDNNGCPSTSFEQYTVYDHTKAIADLLPVVCRTNDQFTVSNPTALATAGILTTITFDKLQSYYLDNLVSRVPNLARPPGATLVGAGEFNQIIAGPGWANVLANNYIVKLFNQVYPAFPAIPYPLDGPTGGFNPANNPVPGPIPPLKTYFNYRIDDATILNAKSIDGSIPNNPYDYFVALSPQGNTFYNGGSLGIVEFEGTYQSIANSNVTIPLIQNVEYFVPAVPIIETSSPSTTDINDTNNPVGAGNPGSIQVVGPGGSRSSNKGTPVFCELGPTITINGYPAASPGSSVGRFRLFTLAGATIFDATLAPITVTSATNNGGNTQLNLSAPLVINVGDYIALTGATPAGINGNIRVLSIVSGSQFTINLAFNGVNSFTLATVTAGGFTDNGNGIASIDPTLLRNSYRDIRVEYEYHELSSPCTSKASQIIRISPNPTAAFTFQSLSGSPYIVSSAAQCEDENITFLSGATSLDPINPSISRYFWDFGDPTSLSNKIDTTVVSQIHKYANPSDLTPYVVKHSVVSFWGCMSVTAAAPAIIQDFVQNVDIGQKPIVRHSLTGVAKGDAFAFVSRNASGSTSVSANDLIKKYTWDFGQGGPGTNTNVRDAADLLTTDAQFNADTVNFTYTQVGPTIIDLTVESNLGCRNSLRLDSTYRDIVVLDTALFVRSTAVYEEQFNTSSGDWQVWATGTTPQAMADALPNASWAHGAPANPFGAGYQTIYDQIAGTGSWKTNITGNYNANESSALYSPSFKMDSLKRPMISFNAIVQTASSDGVVLQFSTDNLNIADPLKSWKTLGTLGGGEDWFNLKALAGNPGEQLVDDLGWSGIDSARWLAPKHTLDTIGKPHPQTVFRFALGVAVGSSPNLGFTLDNVRIGDRTRTILLESFANTGNSNVDEKAEADFVANFQDGTLGTKVVKLNYHVNFPGKDPFNEDNPADPSSRALFYNITSTPRSVLDGQEKGPVSVSTPTPKFSNWGQSLYDLRSLQLAQADIAITTAPVTLPDGTVRLGIGIDVTSNVLTGIQSDAIVHVVVMERGITLPLSPSTPENTAKQALINSSLGYTSFEYVVKQMLPSAAGSAFGPILPYNTSRHFPDPADAASRFIWKAENSKLYDSPDDIAIAVFLQQSTAPYEVYQVEIKEPVGDPATVTGLELISSEQVIVYPNPANREMTVKLPGPLGRTAGMQMVDQTGRVTLQSSIPEGASSKTFNVSDLSGGVYILQIDLGQGVITRKKVMIVHQD